MSQEIISKYSHQIDVRMQHGHIPDLRRVQPCDWFYNNLWRRPYLVQMVYGKYFQLALQLAVGKTLLEVGSGPGHISLEFAREGYHVIGIDMSETCVQSAKKVAAENPYREKFGSLEYASTDVLTWEPPHHFDNICFFGSLCCTENPAAVLDRVRQWLRPGGRVMVLEPARNWFTEKNASLVVLIRSLLAAQNSWYEDLNLPETREEMEEYVHSCLQEYQTARDPNESAELSPVLMKSEVDILTALRSRFDEISYQEGCGFFLRIGGGIRTRSEEKAKKLCEFLWLFDQYAVATGLINPGGFFWVGEGRKSLP